MRQDDERRRTTRAYSLVRIFLLRVLYYAVAWIGLWSGNASNTGHTYKESGSDGTLPPFSQHVAL